MLLARLRIRGKLAVLVLIPLILVAALTAPLVVNRAGLASRAADTARSVSLASDVGALVGDLQQERLLSVGYLLGVVEHGRLTLQTTTVSDRVADLRADLGDDLPATLVTAVDAIRTLTTLRAGVLTKAVRTDAVMAGFDTVANGLIDGLRLLDNIDVATDEGRQVVALDAVLRMNDLMTAGATYLVMMVGERGSAAATTGYLTNLAKLQAVLTRFTGYATNEQNSLYTLVGQALDSRLGTDFSTRFLANPAQLLGRFNLTELFPSMESFIVLGRFVEHKIVTDVTALVAAQERTVLTTAYVVIALALLVLLTVVLLSVAIARAVARPLTQLTRSAERVATVAETELLRVADEDAGDEAEPIHLEPVDVQSNDEIGDLARAFDRVQLTAARLVERQVTSRRNVAQMFGHVGRRTQNLVGRQLAIIDRLEQQETEPSRLQHLYRLDHVSSRLRRNAGSLVVLSGTAGAAGAGAADEHTSPLALADVVRLALGEIEEFTRVDVQVPPGAAVAPAVTGDLVLLLAELMENATVFSPPHTRVTVSAVSPTAAGQGARLRIVDQGLGMSPERLAEENTRLAGRERLDLAPTEVLGLFVVGRLARKHGLGVALSETPGGGVTATIDIRPELLVPGGLQPPAPAALQLAQPPRPSQPARGLASVRQLHTPPLPAGEPPIDRAVARAIVATTDQEAALNVVALDRATRTLGNGRPWNAFAPSRHSSGPVAPAAPPPPATPRVVPGALRQRVPGAQLPDGVAGTPPPVAGEAAAGGDAASARALFEDFEAGVRRAQATDVPAANGVPAAAEMPVAGAKPAAIEMTAVIHMPAVVEKPPVVEKPRKPLVIDQSAAIEAPVVMETPAVIEAPKPGPRPGLTRRVPGATLPTSLPPPRAAQTLPDQWSPDPESARDLIEEFESGVARALQEGPQSP